jgi:tetratricopeptide (TPR) repeat protein
MAKASAHKWEFRARFRRHAFGWKSQPAIKRIKEAVSEIRKVARKDKLLAAEGAVLFLERVSPALEPVDSSSGAIGAAVNNAIAALVEIIATAPADEKRREKWLERLWEAYQDDEIPYIERLGDHWGELCASKEIASRWADELLGASKMAWSPDPNLRGFFNGTTNCLSALLAAERHDELLALLEVAPHRMWHYRQYGVKALAAQGRKAEAIRYAEEGRGRNDSPNAIARVCEDILISSGLADEAYERYGLLANQAGTHAAWFRAVAKKYPHKEAAAILEDLVALTPGGEGKWFAAAKAAKLFDEAIALANRTPGSPQTLTRAARDFEETRPEFALEAGMAALHWLVEGYGYQITNLDVQNAYSHSMKAAENAGCAEQTQERIRDLVSRETFGERFVTKVLGRQLGLS